MIPAVPPVIWLAQFFEAGFWTRELLGRWLNHDKARNTLIFGSRAPRSLPFLDRKLVQYAGPVTKADARVVKYAARIIREAANTRALEPALLIFLKYRRRVQKKEPGWKVRFCL